MDLFIHKDFFHLPFHLKWNSEGKLQKTNSITGLAVGTKEFDTFAKLYLLDIPSFPPDNFLKSYKSLLRFSGIHSVPWGSCIPEDLFIECIRDFGNKVYAQVKDLDVSYYETYFEKGNSVLKALQPAKINLELYEQHKDHPIARTFEPDENGFAEVPVYSRVETVTGRLKVMSGANMLNLKREHRSMLASRWGDKGRIYYLDFKSLEPRFLLTLNPDCGTLPLDIYEDINKGIDKNLKVSRAHIKAAVISEMYGAGLDTLREQIPDLNETDLLAFVGMIHDYLGVGKVKTKLIEEYERNDRKYIQNIYRRFVSTVGAAPYALPNRLIQSSAVDVAQIGFCNVIDYVKEMNWKEFIIPIFLLHDALLLDIHENYFETVPTLCKIGAIDIPLLERFNFYLKAEELT